MPRKLGNIKVRFDTRAYIISLIVCILGFQTYMMLDFNQFNLEIPLLGLSKEPPEESTKADVNTKTTIPTPISSPPTIKPTPTIIQKQAAAPPTPKVESESIDEQTLWDALNTYRKSHNLYPLSKNERACEYARKRVRDHQERTDVVDHDKVGPLDHHEGFVRDTESGYASQVTGYTRIMESLAFRPNTVSPVHVIEWSWDSSTAHRSMMLTEEVGSGCIATDGYIFVAIFGN